jgi:nitrogen regulatory protein P-II 1
VKFITVIADQMSDKALAIALPAEGVTSVTVTESRAFSRSATAVESYRGRKIERHFSTVYRVELVVEDEAANRVIEGIAFARSAGLLGTAQAWVSANSAIELFGAAHRAIAAA